jgi:DNA repair exonuclease SbcCD ATPase subunit
MLISLKLKNFRKHKDFTINFTSGLNVLRGANESGKTSTQEAILYALYGTSALRDSLSDVVTWGSTEKDLSVELIIRVDNALFRFSRSKSGAECNYEGGKVTGQKEVSSFASDLLGADVKTSSVLMMASQNSLRGALDDGPAAVSGLMAKLADFDVIDRLLAAADSKLLLGAAAPMQTKLTTALAELESADLDQVAGAAGLILELGSQVKEGAAEILKHEATESDSLQPAMMAADAAVEAARAANEQRQRVTDGIKARISQHLAETQKLAEAQAEASSQPSPDGIATLRVQVQKDVDHDKVLAAYQAFQKLPAFPESHWEGDWQGMEDESNKLTVARDETRSTVQRINAEVLGVERSKITSGKCPTCGHAALGDDHVAAHNAEIALRVAELRLPLPEHDKCVLDTQADITILHNILLASRKLEALVRPLLAYVDLDHNFVPSKVTWRGEAPGVEATGAAAKQLKEMEAQGRAADQAQGRVNAHRARLSDLDAEIASFQAREAAMPIHDLAPLSEAYDLSYANYAANASVLREHKATLGALKERLSTLELSASTAKARLTTAQARVKEIEADLKSLARNNNLVKKLKGLKPLITDSLWNTVLAAVSSFFSQMRGEQSVVTKDKDGFKVNSQKISSLSGSTLDVLALAIRVALTKTFIPHASFMLLDEPSSGCDMERTGNLLGFLAGVGFDQVLLASHDDLSEAVADNVILLGA